MAGNLAQQHRLKSTNKKQSHIHNENKLDSDSLPSLPVKNGEKSDSTLNDSNDRHFKRKKNDLPTSKEIKIRFQGADDEKAENDLKLRKIPDDGIVHKNSGQLSPFELEANVEEVAKKKANLEEKALLSDLNKSGKDTKQNSEGTSENLGVKKRKGKENRFLGCKDMQRKQRNPLLLMISKHNQAHLVLQINRTQTPKNPLVHQGRKWRIQVKSSP